MRVKNDELDDYIDYWGIIGMGHCGIAFHDGPPKRMKKKNPIGFAPTPKITIKKRAPVATKKTKATSKSATKKPMAKKKAKTTAKKPRT